MVSSAHAVCSKGLYIAMISTTVETDKPELEIRPALDLLGDILEMFVQINTIYDPVDNGKLDNLYVTKSYDATSHFEQASDEVLELYERITGEKLDLNIEPTDDEEY
jgi:Rab GDP dissociation inhibitor